MLDLLEYLGMDFDGLDQGHSLRLCSWIFPNSKPQSICSYVVETNRRVLIFLIGRNHCVRSWNRYQ